MKSSGMIPVRQANGGNTLLLALVMLTAISLLTIVAFNLSRTNLQIAGNLQQHERTLTAAQAILEKTISTTTFTSTPNVATAHTVSLNGNSSNDITVTVTPTCISSQVIPTSQLSYSNSDDAGCLIGVSQQMGISGAASANSLCANQLWDLSAVATDNLTQASAEIHAGVAVRTAATVTCP